jgi:hypothetical protein
VDDTDELMGKVDARILGFDMIHKVLEAIEKGYHCNIEPSVVKKAAKMQVSGTVELVASLVSSRFLNSRERSHRNEAVATR